MIVCLSRLSLSQATLPSTSTRFCVKTPRLPSGLEGGKLKSQAMPSLIIRESNQDQKKRETDQLITRQILQPIIISSRQRGLVPTYLPSTPSRIMIQVFFDHARRMHLYSPSLGSL